MQTSWPEYEAHPFAASDADIKFLIEDQSTEQLFSNTVASAEITTDLEGLQGSQRSKRARDRLTTQHSSSKDDLRSRIHQTANPAALAPHPTLALPLPSECGVPAPISAFHTHSEQSDPASNLRITFTQPSSDKTQSGDLRQNSKLSTTPSDNIDTTCHMALRKRSSSLMTTSAGDPADEEDDEEDMVPIQRPLIQTGINAGAGRRGASDPPRASGGRRVVRSSEERKAHRMAKNRATAAASRKRKQAMKEELLQKADLLQMENAQLCELLKGRDAEIHHLRERLAVAEMIPPRLDAACGEDQLPLFTGSPTF
ncbi:hypothetical protein WJX73_004129 [Symbiochloris irregularis]|uniref:BZIP domain-containing protein n=1 Tax=Symbiochloris irregularis TaxID=706552 RepID=A0AAW1P2C6_9CHLO